MLDGCIPPNDQVFNLIDCQEFWACVVSLSILDKRNPDWLLWLDSQFASQAQPPSIRPPRTPPVGRTRRR
jgi:hypothetical protein